MKPPEVAVTRTQSARSPAILPKLRSFQPHVPMEPTEQNHFHASDDAKGHSISQSSRRGFATIADSEDYSFGEQSVGRGPDLESGDLGLREKRHLHKLKRHCDLPPRVGRRSGYKSLVNDAASKTRLILKPLVSPALAYTKQPESFLVYHAELQRPGDGPQPSSSVATTSPQIPTEDMCGCCGYRPSYLQRFRTSGWVLASLCSMAFTDSFVANGCLIVVLPTIERRFNLRSFESGMILSGYNVVNCLIIVPVAFLGSKRNKPVIISSGMVLIATGSLVFTLCYVLAPPYTFSRIVEDLCTAEPQYEADQCTNDIVSNFRFLLMVGSMLHGAGVAPLQTLGVSFLDENLPPRLTSAYIGAFSSMAVLGPVCGFLVAGYFLTQFVDLTDASAVGLTEHSTVWVGAWWVGFAIASVLGFVLAVPMAAFPKRTADYHAPTIVKLATKKDDQSEEEYGKSVYDIPWAVLSLFSNVTFVLLTLSSASETFLGTAVSAFATKFFESQFSIPASKAATILGCIALPSGCGGAIVGGVIVSKLELTLRSVLKMCCIMAIIPWLWLWMFYLHCPNDTLFEGRKAGKNTTFGFLDKCNFHCNCRQEFLNPVCSVDNIVFVSPCFAGCSRQQDDVGDAQAYSNCSCITAYEETETLTGATVYVQAKRVKCPNNCGLLPTFMVGIFLCIFFTFLTIAPVVSATLRCVEHKERAVALAVKWIVVRTFGNIPAPIILGYLIDRSCNVWQSVCGTTGSCLNYDNEGLSLSMLYVLLPAKTASILFYYMAMVLQTDL